MNSVRWRNPDGARFLNKDEIFSFGDVSDRRVGPKLCIDPLFHIHTLQFFSFGKPNFIYVQRYGFSFIFIASEVDTIPYPRVEMSIYPYTSYTYPTLYLYHPILYLYYRRVYFFLPLYRSLIS